MVISLLTAGVTSASAEESVSAASGGLPSKIDLRDYNGMNYVTPVKRQSPFGTCWAFAACAAAETSYLYQNGLGVPAGEENELVDFSEKQISWYSYQRINEENVKTGRVRASQLGEGADNSLIEANDPNAPYTLGGLIFGALKMFASGIGPVTESTQIDGEYPFAYRGKNGWRLNNHEATGDEAALRKDYFRELWRVYADYYVEAGAIESVEDYDALFDSHWDDGGAFYRASLSYGGNYASYDDWSLPDSDEYFYGTTAATVKSIHTLPWPALKNEQGEYVFNQAGIDAVKNEIANGRAVGLSIHSDQTLPGDEITEDGSLNTDTWAQYTGFMTMADHAVTIIGYDDNYPKENFTRRIDGVAIEGSTPPADGAFIVKNSWGAVTDEDLAEATLDEYGNEMFGNPDANHWGIDDSGYFYLSYYDQTMCNLASCEFYSSAEAQKYADYNYDQYDLFQILMEYGFDRDGLTMTANVFDAEEDEYLRQIAFLNTKPDATVSYAVYKDVEQGDPDSGVLLEEGTVGLPTSGIHRIDLEHEYFLKKGETYSVVITETYTDGEGVERYRESYCGAGSPAVDSIPCSVINAGESYRYMNGEWSDLSGFKDELIDEMYAFDVDLYGEEAVLLNVPGGHDYYYTDNYSIRAYLLPADKRSQLRGDADVDGELSVLDATCIQRVLADLSFKYFDEKLADVDGDSEVTILDATAIQRRLAGLPSAMDVVKPDNDALYASAVRDAMIAEEDEIMPLVNIGKDDENVIWDGDKVLVLFMHKYPDSYPAGEDVELKWGNVWCVSAGEMYAWIQANSGVKDWTERLHQVLGMPTSKGYTTITALWVDADLLYRPANVTDPAAAMTLTYQPTGDKEFDAMYKPWFDSNIIRSYFDSAYPWTRLGYSYDWADNGTEYGLSEFLIFSGATVNIEYTYSVDECVAYAKAQ